jgi:hypothetical protein
MDNPVLPHRHKKYTKNVAAFAVRSRLYQREGEQAVRMISFLNGGNL